MGRKTLLTDDMHKEIIEHLSLGMPISDVCAHVGIDDQTYYNWRNRGLAEKQRLASNGNTRKRDSEQIYIEFFEASTRAQVAARRASVAAVRTWLTPQEQRNVTTKTVSETRLRKVKQEDGSIEEVPYTYSKTEVTEAVIHHPPDWRAGIEYLKRRDNANWSDKITVTIEDMRQQAILDIQAGKLTYESLAAEDESLADELFASAGVPVEARTGATE